MRLSLFSNLSCRGICGCIIIGILQSRKTMELRSRCLFWYSVGCGWPVRCESDSSRGRGHRRSLTLACLHGLQPFFHSLFFAIASVSSKLERPLCTVCLQADRLRAVASQLFWSMFKVFRSLLRTSLVCLWDIFHAQVLCRGGLWRSVRRPCARRGQASAYVSVSAHTHTHTHIHPYQGFPTRMVYLKHDIL